jgi:uncharacterized membrane protein YhhN
MRSKSTLLLSFAFLLAALFSVAGDLSSDPRSHHLATPLATLCVLFVALCHGRWLEKTYALWISLGLFFSLLGDIALLRPAEYFLAGLIAFLFAHLAYLVALTRDTKFPARFSVCGLYLVVAAILYRYLFPGLPAALRFPVAVYAMLLSSMAGQAMGRYLVHRSRLAGLTAAGALLFLISDALLSLDRFRSRLPLSSLLILGPYFLGQWLLAEGTREP